MIIDDTDTVVYSAAYSPYGEKQKPWVNVTAVCFSPMLGRKAGVSNGGVGIGIDGAFGISSLPIEFYTIIMKNINLVTGRKQNGE